MHSSGQNAKKNNERKLSVECLYLLQLPTVNSMDENWNTFAGTEYHIVLHY